MTSEKAIERLKTKLIDLYEYKERNQPMFERASGQEDIEALEMAIVALERLKPVPTCYVCSKCGTRVERADKFCKGCGLFIEWKVEE